MEHLQSRLRDTQRQTRSDLVWATANACYTILSEFRTRAQNGTLPIVGTGADAHYKFHTGDVDTPADWLRDEDYVLRVLAAATGLEASRAGLSIILRTPKSDSGSPPATTAAAAAAPTGRLSLAALQSLLPMSQPIPGDGTKSGGAAAKSCGSS